MARVLYKSVTKKFGDITAVDDLNLEIHDGEFMVFLGPSGCGKTTALRLVAGLEDTTEGEVYIGEQLINDVDPSKRDVAMVFQNYALYPHMSAYGNIAFPLRMFGVPKEKRHHKVLAVAELLDIKPLLNKQPNHLSGGEQQRVALARAIVREPSVFLLDEPLSNLDAKLRVRMRFELRKLLKETLGTTSIYVTHDQVEAMTMADRIAIIQHGKLQQVGQPNEIFDEPSNTFVASFIGSPAMNIVEGDLSEREGLLYLDAGTLTLPIPKTYRNLVSKFKRIVVGFRPQHMQVEFKKQKGFLQGTLLGVERLGTEMFCHLEYGDTEIVLMLPPDSEAKTGDKVYWLPDPDKIHFFDASGRRASLAQ